ncbi:MAG: MotA/TolQ/ExbB proton channel family protein [Hydrotalea sp.]|nr:MotA/TolQ/ExbB proton channel family protein [Hydrotalea sp.]
MKIESIEILLVVIIVAVQIYVFVRTFNQIRIFKFIIPAINSLRVVKIPVPTIDFEKLSPKEIIANINSYKKSTVGSPVYTVTDEHSDSESPDQLFLENQNYISTEKTEVNIIESDDKNNYVFEKILLSTNSYLIRNRGAASDFNLIKDIVERNIDSVEEDINSSVGIPLYLGLMGTMIGIVIGLFNMPEMGIVIGDTTTMDIKLNEGIGLLIGGVKIAMIASFVGLFFTIIHSGWIFKGSRSFSEARKNEFYTFVQIELLPLINEGLASTLVSLQRNLLKFNNEFTHNLSGLSGIFDSSRKAIREQKELLDAIDKAKVSDMTKYNVAVLKQLDISVGQFEKFNSYLTNVTQFVENSQSILSRTNELLVRTDNFKKIADNLQDNLSQSRILMEFLSAHFSNLQEHKEFTSNAVADVGHSISETFKELKVHIQNSSEAVKQFTVDETDLLKRALSESKTNLGNLEHLATLKSDLSQFKFSSASQGERLKQSIDELNKNMERSIAVLEQLEKQSFSSRTKRITTSIKNLFKSS